MNFAQTTSQGQGGAVNPQHDVQNIYDVGKILLVNKPYRWTSFDVVKKLRNATRAKKVGHAGTLDPLATGLLIVCTGKATKEIAAIQNAEKEYTGTIFLGAVTSSYDRETPVEKEEGIDGISSADIYNTAAAFTGTIMQVPPLHSAVKIKGQRAYKMARRGVEHELEPKEVTIKKFEITAIELPYIKFRIVCSKGTYIRTIANDFGKSLGCGAYLYDLCRTRIGNYLLEDANDIDALVAIISAKPTGLDRE